MQSMMLLSYASLDIDFPWAWTHFTKVIFQPYFRSIVGMISLTLGFKKHQTWVLLIIDLVEGEDTNGVIPLLRRRSCISLYYALLIVCCCVLLLIPTRFLLRSLSWILFYLCVTLIGLWILAALEILLILLRNFQKYLLDHLISLLCLASSFYMPPSRFEISFWFACEVCLTTHSTLKVATACFFFFSLSSTTCPQTDFSSLRDLA